MPSTLGDRVYELALLFACILFMRAGQSGRCEDDNAGQHPADALQRGTARPDQPKCRGPQRAGV